MITFLDEQLNTNYIPSPDEITKLRHELRGPERIASDLEEEARRISQHLKKLGEKQAVLDRQITGYKGMLSPARRVVPDVLREIFFHCLPVDRNPAISVDEAPLVLGSVCSQWRQIAYTAPALWSAIHVVIPLNACRHLQSHLYKHPTRIKAIKDWLSRSGISPIRISIHIPFPKVSDNDAKYIVKSYLKTILAFATRCQSLRLTTYLNDETIYLQNFKGITFPLLRDLYLETRGFDQADWMQDAGLQSLPVFASKSLQDVTLMAFGPQAPLLPLPWEQLTTLDLFRDLTAWYSNNTISFRSALSLLSWCPRLKRCSLPVSDRGEIDPTGLGGSFVSVLLPDLTGLNMYCDCDPKPFFLHLTTPSLRYFRYNQEMQHNDDNRMNGDDQGLHISLRPFIQKVVQPIKEFHFHATELTVKDFTECLKLFPDIQHLSLVGFGHESNGLTRMSEYVLELFMRGIDGPNCGRMVRCGREPSDSEGKESSTEDGNLGGTVVDSDCAEPICLFPKLEALKIAGASFSHASMLRFMRSRMLPGRPRGVSRLRWLEIEYQFGNSEAPCEAVYAEVEELRKITGAHIEISFYGGWMPLPQDLPAYEGLSVGPEGNPEHIFDPAFS